VTAESVERAFRRLVMYNPQLILLLGLYMMIGMFDDKDDVVDNVKYYVNDEMLMMMQ